MAKKAVPPPKAVFNSSIANAMCLVLFFEKLSQREVVYGEGEVATRARYIDENYNDELQLLKTVEGQAEKQPSKEVVITSWQASNGLCFGDAVAYAQTRNNPNSYVYRLAKPEQRIAISELGVWPKKRIELAYEDLTALDWQIE